MAEKVKEKVVLEEGEEKGEVQPKKSRRLILILAVALGVILLLGGGGTAAYLTLKTKLKPKPPAEGESPAAAESMAHESAATANVPLESFVVNLNDPGSSRYLKVDMVLELKGTKCPEAVAAKKDRLRDSILLLLRSKTLADLQDVDGVLTLKKEVIVRTNMEQQECKATNVFFTNLVIQ